tara:strand:- start:883 stop:1923 length:1041 start_codon:yes stop_codon:yes gene_type:complete
MLIGRLDRQITIYKRTFTRDDFGASKINTTASTTAFAHIEFKSGSAKFDADSMVAQQNVEITIRWTADIGTSPEFYINDSEFGNFFIRNVKQINKIGRREGLLLECDNKDTIGVADFAEFVPSSIIPRTSLKAWYKFKTDASASQWTDQSGNSNNATQSVLANQPSYNSTTGAFGFDVTKGFELGSALNLDARTLIFAIDFNIPKTSGTANFNIIMQKDGASASLDLIQAFLPGDFFYTGGTTATITAIAANGTVTDDTKVLLTYELTGQAQGNVLKVRKNGTQIATNTNASGDDGNGTYDRIGVIGGINRGMEGNIYEIAIFDEVLSGTDLTAVENEIMTRTGIS